MLYLVLILSLGNLIVLANNARSQRSIRISLLSLRRYVRKQELSKSRQVIGALSTRLSLDLEATRQLSDGLRMNSVEQQILLERVVSILERN